MTRHDARLKLSQEVRRAGGDDVVVTSVDLSTRERECPKSSGRDRIAQATVAGTAITRFGLPAQPADLSALTIIPLGDRHPGAPSGLSRDVTFGTAPRACSVTGSVGLSADPDRFSQGIEVVGVQHGAARSR